MAVDPQTTAAQQLSRAWERANMQATMHSKLRDEYSARSLWLNILALLSTAFLLTFVMVSEDLVQRTVGITPDGLKWLNGFAAFAAFSLTLVDLVWRPAASAAAHDQAVRHYTRAKYDIQQLQSNMSHGMEVSSDEATEAIAQYLDDRDLPRIPDARFLQLKRWHKCKVATSRQLDLTPCASLKEIRKRLSNQHDGGKM